jgi:predicted pyridoxine 5'-phosphate oxidase superfamily flavin-nucleotide-binding protein
MPKLTQEMMDLVAQQQCFVATVSPEGLPNVAPKRSTRVLDDEHLTYCEITARRTWRNVQAGSKVAIAAVNRESMTGFRFVGTPEIITSGPAFDMAAKAILLLGIRAPLTALIRVTVEQIVVLGGPHAGEEIG